MGQIHYVIGDASDPVRVNEDPVIIAHVCNDKGGWGSGFVVALSNRDQRPEQMYRVCWASSHMPLGEVSMSLYDPKGQERDQNIFVANMIAQHGFKSADNPVPLDYKVLWECLVTVGEEAADMSATVHMPRIGCGLGGGDWTKVEDIIQRALVDLYHLDVYVYDLPTPQSTAEIVEVHHELDEMDQEFQKSLHELAARCSACGQILPSKES